jgi:hypothetical protein
MRQQAIEDYIKTIYVLAEVDREYITSCGCSSGKTCVGFQ